MEKKRLLKIAAVLMIGAGALNIVWAVIAISGFADIKEMVRYSWVISPLPYFGVATGFTGHTGLSDMLAIAYVSGILAGIIGGIVFLFKNTIVSWLTGTMGALLCLPLLGIASIVVTVLSRSKSDG